MTEVYAPEIMVRLRGQGVMLRLDGDALVATPLDLLTPELLRLIQEHESALVDYLKPPGPDAHPGFLSVMALPLHPCTDCRRLERGRFCTHYRSAMPEPRRECRCVHFEKRSAT